MEIIFILIIFGMVVELHDKICGKTSRDTLLLRDFMSLAQAENTRQLFAEKVKRFPLKSKERYFIIVSGRKIYCNDERVLSEAWELVLRTQ